MSRDPGEIPTATSSTTWTMITEVLYSPERIHSLGTDMIIVFARDLGVEPPRLLLGLGIHPPDGEEAADGVRMNFNITLSLDGVKLSADHASIVEAWLRRAAPSLTRVPEGS